MQRGALGKIGEDLVEMFLVKRGYTILDRNFIMRRLPPPDIVSKTDMEIPDAVFSGTNQLALR